MIDVLLDDIESILTRNESRDVMLLAICRLLAEKVGHYDWVGFYIADPEKRLLSLGPFVGEPTEHTLIPYGKGICGQSAESGQTFLIQDVSAQDNYLACSISVQSEIVVPVIKNGQYVAQLDIDSHQKAPFTDKEKEFLEKICERIALLF